MAESGAWHTLKNLFLLCLSFSLLFIDTAVIKICDFYGKLFHNSPVHEDGESANRRTILVTGVGMAKGLTLARLFHRSGHRVIGADFYSLSIGRVSRAIDKFYVVPSPAKNISSPARSRNGHNEDPYVARLLDIIATERIDLWVSVSDVNAAMQDAQARDIIEARGLAKCVQLGADDVEMLHEKDYFMRHTSDLGLPIPDTHVVTSKEEIIDILARKSDLSLNKSSKRYLLKPLGVDDVARFDMPLLPLVTEDRTLQRLDRTSFGASKMLLMQEFIEGDEYCTHALVCSGQVRAFVACRSSGLLMHYEALPPESPLSRSMLAFTQIQAKAGGEKFTGHVSFDFLVSPSPSRQDGKQGRILLFPIECNPRVHTATVLFNNTPEIVDEYLSVIEHDGTDYSSRDRPVAPKEPRRYYWIGQDLVELVMYPLYQCLLQGTMTPREFGRSILTFISHVWLWKDGTFEVWDPWPWWWLYHVYWPVQFVGYLLQGRWHKINVSTGKAFMAK